MVRSAFFFAHYGRDEERAGQRAKLTNARRSTMPEFLKRKSGGALRNLRICEVPRPRNHTPLTNHVSPTPAHASTPAPRDPQPGSAAHRRRGPNPGSTRHFSWAGPGGGVKEIRVKRPKLMLTLPQHPTPGPGFDGVQRARTWGPMSPHGAEGPPSHKGGQRLTRAWSAGCCGGLRLG